MNKLNSMSRRFVRAAGVAFALATMAFGIIAPQAHAQKTTTTTIRNSEASFDTQVRNAEVLYVEGNDLVLRLEDGKVEHLVVPDSDKFTINGSDVSVHELTPGTKLTQTITTSTAPRYVTTVDTIKGRVWHVNAHSSLVILTLPDGTNHPYTIASHAKVTVGGQPKTVYDIRKGMTLEATTITDDTQTVVERNESVVGYAPASPATPREVGILLIVPRAQVVAADSSPVMVASDEQPASTLPATGSSLPLIGLLGGLALAGSFGMGAIRKAVRA
ncbi:MAG TPA: hypothetical protein VHX49_17270 [Candidatus Acidoferrales bacterium]|jgi:hypothetical protein|nr:hypothetical protein [Candidatus Acidoferrales bacterium]